MNITILTAGSQGDIQPYLALAVGLKNTGYQVKFVANVNFAGFIAGYDLDFYPIQVDSFKFAQTPQGRAWLESDTLLKLIWNTPRVVRPVVHQIFNDVLNACQEADALIYNSFTLPFVHYIGKSLDIPCIPTSTDPLPTRAHPAIPINIKWSGSKTFNILSHILVHQFAWQVFLPIVRKSFKGKVNISMLNPYRQILASQTPVLCAYSSSVLPRPVDLPDQVMITGYWFLESDRIWQPDPELITFINLKQRPIYIGFGSMGNSDKKDSTVEMVLEALAETKQRAVLGAGWSEMGAGQKLPGNIFLLKSIPHRWLFPQMSVVVHHAGPGTTAEALSGGVPSVTVPHFASQYFYADRLAEAGVSPAPIARRHLSTKQLAEAISIALTDQTMRAKADSLGAQIRAEDGIENAVSAIRTFLG